MEWRRTVLVVGNSLVPMPILTEVLHWDACVVEGAKVPREIVEVSDSLLGFFQSFADDLLELASLLLI